MATRSRGKAKEPVRSVSENKSLLATAALGSIGPPWLKPYLEKLGPILAKLGDAVDLLSPYYVKLSAYSEILKKKAEEYEFHLIAPMLFGLVLIFFGGYFVTTIACIEAFRISGWDHVKHGLGVLWADYKKFKAESKVDDERDDDNDGVPDVQQVSSNDLITRKLKLFLKSCNPVQLSEALSGIYTGLIGVIATLRIQFARTITLGANIGKVLSEPAIRFGHPAAAAVIPAEYHNWIDVVIKYTCKTIGVSIAFTLQRIISTVHSALRGAQIFCDAFAIYTAKHGFMMLSTGYWDEVLMAVCALLGFYLQISSWFSLPWILYIPLFPLVLVEKFLTYFVALWA